jgi:hypothetical protein
VSGTQGTLALEESNRGAEKFQYMRNSPSGVVLASHPEAVVNILDEREVTTKG